MFSLGSCLFDLNSSVWKHSMLGQVLVVHSCLVQDILTSSLSVRMQGCPSHRGTSVKDKVRWAAQITPALVHPWGADWAHLFVLPFHHHDKYPTCQNITSLLVCEVSYCPAGRTTKIREWKDVMLLLSCPKAASLSIDWLQHQVYIQFESEDSSSSSVGGMDCWGCSSPYRDAQSGFWLERSRTFKEASLSLSCIAKALLPLNPQLGGTANSRKSSAFFHITTTENTVDLGMFSSAEFLFLPPLNPASALCT